MRHDPETSGLRQPCRLAAWGSAVLLLLAPVLAMGLGLDGNWGPGDFTAAAALVVCVGLAGESVARGSRQPALRAGAAVVRTLAAAALVLWANGAVGSEAEPVNRLFLGVPGVALLGAALARFRAPGLAWAMAAAAGARSRSRPAR
jgi:hypothetical protein